MESNWVKIYDVHEYVKAQILQKMLIDNGIPAALINKQDSMYVNFSNEAPIEIFVAKDNAFEAVQLIKKKEELD